MGDGEEVGDAGGGVSVAGDGEEDAAGVGDGVKVSVGRNGVGEGVISATGGGGVRTLTASN
jgi:hypothetical protein